MVAVGAARLGLDGVGVGKVAGAHAKSKNENGIVAMDNAKVFIVLIRIVTRICSMNEKAETRQRLCFFGTSETFEAVRMKGLVCLKGSCVR